MNQYSIIARILLKTIMQLIVLHLVYILNIIENIYYSKTCYHVK